MSLADTNRRLADLDEASRSARAMRDRNAREIADLAAAGLTDTGAFISAVDLHRTLTREASAAEAAYTAARRSAM